MLILAPLSFILLLSWLPLSSWLTSPVKSARPATLTADERLNNRSGYVSLGGITISFTRLLRSVRSTLAGVFIKISLLLVPVLWGCSGGKQTDSVPNPGVRHAATASATFNWATDLCDYQSTYNPTQYTKEQLTNTHALWLDNWYLEAPAVAATPEEIQRLNAATLRRDYEQIEKLLKDLPIVDSPYWHQLKQRRLKALESEYALKQVAISAYAHPQLLRQTAYDPAGAPYVDALITDDSTALLQAWQQLHNEQKKQSGLPDQLEKEFSVKFGSPNQLAFARVELMAYGWWNHIKPKVPYVVPDARMETEFKALFSANQATCANP
ncbi:hypothetical protein GCM10027341_23600 [Spirosoma knui]